MQGFSQHGGKSDQRVQRMIPFVSEGPGVTALSEEILVPGVHFPLLWGTQGAQDQKTLQVPSGWRGRWWDALCWEEQTCELRKLGLGSRRVVPSQLQDEVLCSFCCHEDQRGLSLLTRGKTNVALAKMRKGWELTPMLIPVWDSASALLPVHLGSPPKA